MADCGAQRPDTTSKEMAGSSLQELFESVILMLTPIRVDGNSLVFQSNPLVLVMPESYVT